MTAVCDEVGVYNDEIVTHTRGLIYNSTRTPNFASSYDSASYSVGELSCSGERRVFFVLVDFLNLGRVELEAHRATRRPFRGIFERL